MSTIMPHLNVWESPEITEVNRLPMHTTFHPYDTQQNALSRDPEKSPWVRSLNGTWRICMLSAPGQVESRHIQDCTDTSCWQDIPVPANWNLHDCGKPPQYTNVVMPFPDTPPHVPADDNPTGVYRTTFRVPAGWRKRRVVVHFGGVESCFFLYCNGTFVGMSKDSRLPAEFDLTRFLIRGTNELAVVCLQYSDASYVEDQDHWWMAGIFRDVHLYSTEAVYLEDIAVTSGLESDFRRGTLDVKVKLGNVQEPDQDHTVRVQLFDGRRALWKRGLQQHVSRSYRSDYYEAHLHRTVARVTPWSTEEPHLYTVVVSLLDAGGRIMQVSAVRTGFRSVTVQDRQFLLNGQPVYIKGVCHHDHDPDHGKAVRREVMERDVVLMKQFNLNALRTSHYPSDPYLYDLCDEYGILVIDEANLENHSNYATLCHDPRWSKPYFERITRMVQRDRNHPCIFAWSLCNESGYGENHDRAAAWIRQHDPSRLVHNEGAVKPRWDQGGPNQYEAGGERSSDLISPMYESVPGVIEWAGKTHEERAFILCEYCSCTGNSGGGLAEYWEAFYAHHGLQGGFIWQWSDHGLRQHDRQGRMYWAYGGDFGEKVHDYNFCCNGMVGPDRTPHPSLYEHKKLTQPLRVTAVDAARGEYSITNLDYFRSTAWLRGTWQVEVNGRRVQRGECSATIQAQATRSVRLPIKPTRLKAGQEAVLTFSFQSKEKQSWCARGHEVAWEQFVLDSARGADAAAPRTPKASLSSLRVRTRGNVVTATAGQLVASFDRSQGTLKTLRLGAAAAITVGPRFNLWRTPIDNDGVRGRADHRTGQWKPLGRWLDAGYDRLTCCESTGSVEQQDDVLVVNARQVFTPGAAKGRFIHAQRLRLLPTGRLVCEHAFTLDEGMVDPPRLGVQLIMAPGFDQLTWYGRGPHESYSDRKAGARLGLFQGSVDQQHHPYVVPQENGNKEDVRFFSLRNGDSGIVFRALGAGVFGFSAHPYTPQELEKALHLNQVPRRKDVVLLLDAVQRGLGSGACGPDTLPQYQIGAGTYVLAYEIAGV
jgi:beta-galactosidase